jgi:hypothetical protein
MTADPRFRALPRSSGPRTPASTRTIRTIMKLHHLLAASVLALGLAGCGVFPTACTDELGIALEPAETTIRVGETVRARALGVTCGGREREPYKATWQTGNPDIVSVDGETGVITGLAPGTGIVTAHEPDVASDFVLGLVTVRVVPR